MKHLFTSLVVWSTLIQSAHAQDAKFSQYDNAPLILNPAATGKFEGSLRVGLTGSLQKAGPATLYHGNLFADYRLEANSGSLGIGLSYYQNGHPAFLLSDRVVGLSLARHFVLGYNEQHQLSLGGQVSLAGSHANAVRPFYDSTISGSGFSRAAAGKIKGSTVYSDLSLGLLYTFSADEVELETGLSVYHLLRPETGTKIQPARRLAFTARAGITLTDETTMHLSGLVWKEGLHWKAANGNAPERSESVCGVLLQTQYTDAYAVYYGAGTRNTQTLMVKGGWGIEESLQLMVSYEHPINEKVYRAKRAEVSAIFRFP